MKQESPFVLYFRSGILLTALFAVPGIAICWNWVPQNWLQHKKEIIAPLSSCIFEEEIQETMEAVPEPTTFSIEDTPNIETVSQTVPALELNSATSSEILIPSSFTQGQAVWSAGFADAAPKTAKEYKEHKNIEDTAPSVIPQPLVTESIRVTQKSLPQLEDKLKELGAGYYRLEKWGSKGELFRFSCYVSPSEPYQYQKCFQAIDADPLYVIESVIEEIIQWKGRTNSSF